MCLVKIIVDFGHKQRVAYHLFFRMKDRTFSEGKIPISDTEKDNSHW